MCSILSMVTNPYEVLNGFHVLLISFFFFFSRAIMAEYSGAVLGVLSAVLYGRRGHVWKKVTH